MSQRQIRVFVWILVLCAMVMMMVVIGGVTRLTGSGLSIVEWKPLMGAIPPLTEQDWLDVFNKYQTSPQYQLVNKGMSLPQFQWIFFWEYFHRLIGRLMGIAFLLPWAWFWWKGYFNRRWAGRLLLGFMLGGLQGLMGWLMVASGLVDQPQVSHLRLAAHLVLAFFILSYFWRLAWEFYSEAARKAAPSPINSGTPTTPNTPTPPISPINPINPINPITSGTVLASLKKSLNVVLIILILQIVYGAFVAGLRAGYMYNTFPDMEGQFFPAGALQFLPLWKNFFDNALLVQWLHRTLGWSLALGSLLVVWRYYSFVSPALRKVLVGLATAIITQFCLGALTLVMKVSLPLAVIHQVGASVVLMFLLWLRWEVQAQAAAVVQ